MPSFIDNQSILDLNGPILSFLVQPSPTSTCTSGIVTFVGIATATFPTQTPANTAIPTGSISYRWHLDGYGELSDGDLNGTTIAGSATTTLTLSNVSNQFLSGNSNFFVRVDYIPSAYSLNGVDVDYVQGTQRTTGNATNDPLDSSFASLSVYSNIEITKNPGIATAAQGSTAFFNVSAKTIDDNQGDVEYQWQLNEIDLVDGINTINVPATINTTSLESLDENGLVLALPLWDSGTGTLSLNDVSKNPKTITKGSTWGRSPSWVLDKGKFYGGAAYFDGYSYLNLPASNDFYFGTGDFTVELWVNFQKGLRTDSGSYGGVGGWEVLVAAGGGVYFGGGIWFAVSRSTPLENSSLTNVYLADFNTYTDIGQTTIEVNKWYHFALSKDSTGVKFYIDGVLNKFTSISSWSSRVFGGTEIGYIGLEHWLNTHDRGYYFPWCYMQDLKIYKGVAKYPNNFTPSQNSIISSLLQKVDIPTEVVGAGTSNLTISLPHVSNNLIRAKITHPTACNSPIYSNTSQFDVVSPFNRAVIEVESYQQNSTTATLREFDLTNLDYTINSDVFDSDTICFYAKDRDVTVEFELYGAAGQASTKGVGESGGEGGYSKIRFTMAKNDEYILRGIKSNSALYLYRKSQLIACVGQGGSGGIGGRGGRGGGVGVVGEDGFGQFSGIGGACIPAGQMAGNGIFGSSSTAPLIYSEDSRATGTNGGRTITCSKGVYWKQQGKTACENLGNIKFRLPDGKEVTNSVAINRGFKDGYSINQTAGSNNGTDGGKGGNGAVGGNGGTYGGGGGGSGYTDTSITVVETTLGGNKETKSRLVMRLFEPIGDYYRDSAGRILILSAATPGKDPRTITKTTGRVLPGTDTCIDDTRWQSFLSLAATQDYRLAVTVDGNRKSLIKVTSFNIRRMINANNITLKRSLTDWEDTNYGYQLLALAWDETNASGGRGFGSDYSILAWSPLSAYGYGYYGDSSNPFFEGSTYSNYTANWWILPPGVPDFT